MWFSSKIDYKKTERNVQNWTFLNLEEQHVLCNRSGFGIMAKKVTWNYAYRPFNAYKIENTWRKTDVLFFFLNYEPWTQKHNKKSRRVLKSQKYCYFQCFWKVPSTYIFSVLFSTVPTKPISRLNRISQP